MDNTTAQSDPNQRPPQSPAIVNVYQARLFAIRELRDYTQRLVGGILTIMDAAITDAKQAKALRSLIMRECWEVHYTPALAWAEKEAVIEQKEGIVVQEWGMIETHRSMHPTAVELFNPFPFSTTTLTVANVSTD